ncbi:hypothetical protein [Deminuibacter soli]|uniref:hypothetical protein n=1 Tax=Deminuibacter soli TaxID=2291815 RepID=UPI001313E158|nr:hypothetical protein [Deminuibacter soli]
MSFILQSLAIAVIIFTYYLVASYAFRTWKMNKKLKSFSQTAEFDVFPDENYN